MQKLNKHFGGKTMKCISFRTDETVTEYKHLENYLQILWPTNNNNDNNKKKRNIIAFRKHQTSIQSLSVLGWMWVCVYLNRM